MLTADQLDALIDDGEVDTVTVAFTDMQGRLVGERSSARLFKEEISKHGAECCNYLLAVDVEMNAIDGHRISSSEKGYGDMAMIPDLSTLRLIPWLPGTALVMADLTWLDETPVPPSPREILKKQIARLSEKGLVPYVGTELEFIVFDDTYRDAWGNGYVGLTPVSDDNIDYALLALTRMERLLRGFLN
jgi:glutamine synthetase